MHVKNNNKVVSRRHVKFEIFTKLVILGSLGWAGPINGAIGPVFELSRRLTHILLPAKYQIDSINIFSIWWGGQENLYGGGGI